MRFKRGVTLIELMITLVMTVLILGAASQATFVAINHGDKVKQSRSSRGKDAKFEERITTLLQSAYLSTLTTDTNSYFVYAEGSNSSGAGTSAVGLTFTGQASRISLRFVNATDDFETLNQQYGTLGGITEIAITQEPIGDASVTKGLFLRTQTPADGDLSQGGNQTNLDENISEISYEFYDGTGWVAAWDTQQDTVPRLPSAVRVTYKRTGDTDDHIFVARLPHSDITPENPYEGVSQ
jgi:prepilin-type N-terminal cleavage/methylation domain-containing protein